MLPELLTVGISQRIGESFTLQGTAEWTNWSRLGFPRVFNGATGTLLRLRPTCRSITTTAGSSRWAANIRSTPPGRSAPVSVTRSRRSTSKTAVRACPIPIASGFRSGRPITWSDQLSFDLAYTHIFSVGDTDINIAPGNPLFPTRGVVLGSRRGSSVDIVAASVKYRWDNPTVAIPAPIVRKY